MAEFLDNRSYEELGFSEAVASTMRRAGFPRPSKVQVNHWYLGSAISQDNPQPVDDANWLYGTVSIFGIVFREKNLFLLIFSWP